MGHNIACSGKKRCIRKSKVCVLHPAPYLPLPQDHSNRVVPDFQSLLCGSLPALMSYNVGKKKKNSEKLLLCRSFISAENTMGQFILPAWVFQRVVVLEKISSTRRNTLKAHPWKRAYLIPQHSMWLPGCKLTMRFTPAGFKVLLGLSLPLRAWRSFIKASTWRY